MQAQNCCPPALMEICPQRLPTAVTWQHNSRPLMPQSHLWVRADTGFEIPFAIDFQRVSAQCCGSGRLLSGCQRYYKKPFGRTCKASQDALRGGALGG